ncbi:GNAT family N-acetyltransferase [Streptomyces sp. ME18-1-4]|uniref:GNAT family N-acetyltransferase n=1 Tax=Streptomyces sp. ME18-1-4 TaxID=3028685 RepID=UPI0029BE3D38|nr:GNAT family N-acetyltransferase [Streptomyces sp. ME18-1-4]MDX3240643.1 GNAT family N-acetyltransferase [Streptomyces sp. ME18-1-4]
MIAVRLRTRPTPSAAALLLRPWEAADADDMVEAYRDDALRRWTASTVDDAVGAARWIQEQQRGWETGDRFGLAVVESRESGQREPLVGHVVLKRGSPGSPSAEVGYWTAAHARGRGVVPRALDRRVGGEQVLQPDDVAWAGGKCLGRRPRHETGLPTDLT